MIGVCIKYFFDNYGGMLQAYATVTMLEDRGLDYELIQYQKRYSLWGKIKQLPRLFNFILLNDKKDLLIKKIGKKRHPNFAVNEAIRTAAYSKFKKNKFQKLSPSFIGFNDLSEGAKRYNAIITGSDQLWSPAGLPTNFYNLKFVPDNIRKISIASSFGVKYIPWYQKHRTREYLNRIEHISMRENRGAEIVKELTGRDVPVILDPVFFFDDKGWEKMIPVEKIYDEPYVLAYFLGNSVVHRDAVNKAARDMNCKIVVLRHIDQYVKDDESFGDYAPYDVDPGKFLNLLRGAECIFTDSFHGSVFSIIHRKPFIIFNRYEDGAINSKNSRIDTLCENLGLQNRRFFNVDKMIDQLKCPIPYDVVNLRLNILKENTNMYLDKAFEGL